MLKAIKERRGNTLNVRLIGAIQEDSDLEALIGEVPSLPAELHLNTKEVDRINSSGIRVWVAYFRKVVNSGKKLRFQECSPPIVEQLNVIRDFSCGASIESIQIPFICPNCEKCYTALYPVEKLRSILPHVPSPDCKQCGKPTLLDEMEAEYFIFMDYGN